MPAAAARHVLARLLTVLALVLVAAAASAGERGITRIDLHEPAALGATDYNYGIAQDAQGRIWAANERPMLVFDGARWLALRDATDRTGSHTPLPRGSRVYGSAASELGYFEADRAGVFQWRTLNAQLPADARQFGRVTGPVATTDAVWYLTTSHLVRFGDDGSVQLQPADGFEPELSAIDDAVFVVDPARGLLQARRDGTGIVLDAPTGLAESWRAQLSTPIRGADGARIYQAQSSALLRADGGADPRPFAPALAAQFAALRLHSVIGLRDGGYALGFVRGGVWVLGADGSLRERYDEGSGAPLGSVSDLFEDREGGLWVSQVGSLARIDRGSGLTRFGVESGIGHALAIARHDGRLYASGRTGVFVLMPGLDGAPARFARIDAAPAAAADLRSFGGWLWMAGGRAMRMRFAADGAVVVSEAIAGIDRARGFAASRRHPDRLYVVSIDAAIDVLDAAGSDTPRRRHIGAIDGTSSRIVVDADENLWASGSDGSIWRLQPDASDAVAQRFDAASGLPSSGAIDIDALDGAMVVVSDLGVLRFDAVSGRFVPFEGLDGPLAHAPVTRIHADAQGNLQARGPAAIGMWRHTATGYQWDAQALAAVSPLHDAHAFLREGEVLWIARADGVERVELGARPRLPPLAPLLTRLHDLRSGIDLPLSGGTPAALGSSVRDLQLGVALPVFSGPAPVRYRTRLIGYDGDWSPWSELAERVYTNLPDGDFRFEAQAWHGPEFGTATSSLAFAIAPPWWRSALARAAGAALALALLLAAGWLGGQRRQRALLARQQVLESVVAERTQELASSNRQLAEQAERLTEVDRLKTRFFINVGHEFRTPLTLVLGPLDDLLRDARFNLGVQARELLEMADRNARRVLDLIVELLDINRFEHGQLRLHRCRTDLAQLLTAFAADARALVSRFGHELHCEGLEDGPLWVDIDPLQVERCLSNLVGNAAKFMPRGGRIVLRLLRAGDGGGCVEVQDTGRGIAAAALPHVFDRFFQADGSAQASGYGIGLSLVREIADAHGGSVGVRSTPGAGSVFMLALPAAAPVAAGAERDVADEGDLADEGGVDDDAPADANAAPASSPQAAQRTRVLVVDDHADMRRRVCGLLADRFELLEAADGPSAWACVREALPDVVVCDVMMPGFDGIELARRMRADPETAAIALLLLTARTGSEHAVEGLRAGADDYLEKPFDASELQARIDALLARARRLRERLARERAPALAAALEQPMAAVDAPGPAQPDADRRWRQRLDAAIEQRLDDETFDIDALARAMHCDRSQLFRRCKQLLELSPSDYLRDTRLQRAHGLLQAMAGNVSEIAYAVGFESLSSFTRAFRKRYGVAPSSLQRGTARERA